MIKVLQLIFLLSIASPLIAQESISKNNSVLLRETSHNFGKIQQGKPVTHDFKIINSGNAPLQIRDVQASCGCTTPEWSSAPIAPGDSAVVKIGYNSLASGEFNKPVTLLFIGQDPKTITITGDVYPNPATSVPLHSSISFLKAKNQ